MNLRQQFHDKAFLKLVHAKKACPLRLEDRLVYSLLVFASARKVPRSRRWLASRLCLNKNTVCRSVRRLTALGLVDGATSMALQPGAQHEGWFSYLLTSQKKWQNQFRYMPVLIPSRIPKNLSWRSLVVFWWLLSKTDDESDDLDRPYAAAEIARILGLTAPTVTKMLKTALKPAIDRDEKGRVVRCFVPEDEWLDSHFIESKPKGESKASKEAVSEMTEAEKYAYLERESLNQSEKAYAHLELIGGFAAGDIRWIKSVNAKMLEQREHLCTPDVIMDLYGRAQEEHSRNVAAGKYTSGNCWRLFHFKFVQHCKSHGFAISA